MGVRGIVFIAVLFLMLTIAVNVWLVSKCGWGILLFGKNALLLLILGYCP